MNNIQAFRILAIKVLTIIGFVATIVVLLWLAYEGMKRLPSTFASLASIIESVNEYRPSRELTLATEKTVVNSGESFRVSWTDMKQDGEYRLTYTCVDGITFEAEDTSHVRTPFSCTDGITYPSSVTETILHISSENKRLDDASFVLTFKSATGDVRTNTAKITVVNATIPVGGALSDTVADEKETGAKNTTTDVASLVPDSTTPVSPVPVPAITLPVSNPYGYVDLSLETIGIGVIRNGEFVYTASYDSDRHNIIKFNVRNLGTKTSDLWYFKIELPGGNDYKSATQMPLKPGERVEFTLGFDFDDSYVGSHVRIENAVYTDDDTRRDNNTSVWSVAVRD